MKPLELTDTQALVLDIAALPDQWLGTRAEGTLARAMRPFELGAEDARLMPVVQFTFGPERAAQLEGTQTGDVFWVQETYCTDDTWTRYKTAIGYTRWYDPAGYQWDGRGSADEDFRPASSMTPGRTRYAVQLIGSLTHLPDGRIEGTFRLHAFS